METGNHAYHLPDNCMPLQSYLLFLQPDDVDVPVQSSKTSSTRSGLARNVAQHQANITNDDL